MVRNLQKIYRFYKNEDHSVKYNIAIKAVSLFF